MMGHMVPLGGGGTVFPLDTISDAELAYSVRRLFSTYTGPLVRLRRSSDNAEKDFYPDNTGWLSMDSEDGSSTTLSSWVGANNATVVRWYSQGATTSTLTLWTGNAPQLVSSGVLNTENGKATLLFDGIMRVNHSPTGTYPDISLFYVSKRLASIDAVEGDRTVIYTAHGPDISAGYYYLLANTTYYHGVGRSTINTDGYGIAVTANKNRHTAAFACMGYTSGVRYFETDFFSDMAATSTAQTPGAATAHNIDVGYAGLSIQEVIFLKEDKYSDSSYSSILSNQTSAFIS